MFHNNFFLIWLLLSCSVLKAQPLKPVNSIPHDPITFTQGFIVKDHIAWESSGLYNRSFIRQWDLRTGRVLQQKSLDRHLFAEGLTELNGALFLITWRAGKAFKIDPNNLSESTEYSYEGEGWGLTTDGQQLIMSNGSHQLQFINPNDFSVKKTINVNFNGNKVRWLNELEWINGLIWANVFQTDYIVVIDPKDGTVLQRHLLTNLLGPIKNKPGVLNGIAYDEVHKKIWITGKNWPKVFEFSSSLAKAVEQPD